MIRGQKGMNLLTIINPERENHGKEDSNQHFPWVQAKCQLLTEQPAFGAVKLNNIYSFLIYLN